MTHPYQAAAPYQRWRKAMVEPAPGAIDPMVAAPWRIAAADRIATGGSCFAQHLVRRLRKAGIEPLETESAHPMLPPETAAAFGYGLFSARYGAIYTARQLLQLFRRAYGDFVPQDDAWSGPDGAVFDPFRPSIQPGGFPTAREYALDRRQHFAAIRAMFEQLDVFVFTLGLTECWADRADGAVYPLCPGVAAGHFDPDRHELLNLGVRETVEDLDAFLAGLRAVNPQARLILTVSPVPLAATAEPRHVWTATSYSKAALRVAAEEIATRPGVIYFPSYEIITSPAARGGYFAPDLRSISEDGVDHVMRVFFDHLVEDGIARPQPPAPQAADPFLEQARRAVEVLCDEARLDPPVAVSPQPSAVPVSSDGSTGGGRRMALLKLLNPMRRLLAAAEPVPAASVTVRARQLADAGHYRAAIDLLAPVPTDQIDLQTLRDLVRWRNAAFEPEAGRPDWPPRLPDPFPGVQGPPEIAAKALTAGILGGAIQHHGCLLVRGLIDAAQTHRLAEVVARAIDAGSAGDDQPPSPWFAPYPLGPGDGMSAGARKFVTGGGAVWTADSPHALADFLTFLKTHSVVRVIEEYLGERAFLSIGKSTLRRVPPDTTTGWHQDGRFLGADIRTVNCWLALSDCGDDAPGLDLFPKRQAALVESGTEGAFDWWVVGDGVADAMARTTQVVTPLFKAGDALLFDQMLLHRTGARPGLKRERLAIESWFFAGSTFPMQQMPLAL